MDASKELTLKNPLYKKTVMQYVWQTYKADAGMGDVTTDFFLAKPDQKVTACITLNEPGIVAGMQEAFWLLEKTALKVTESVPEGNPMIKGSVLMKIYGKASGILAVERTLLNLLQRMSGIATYTYQLKKKLPPHIHLLATRKTLWGLLDKRAVVVGGGTTHRLSLNDAVLIKDTHLQLSRDWEKGFQKTLKKAKKLRFTEIELDSPNDVEVFLNFYKAIDEKYKKKVIVMLDNFNPLQVKETALTLQEAGVLVEVSGGINEENIQQYILPGVSAISCGSLTSRSHGLDMSLHFDVTLE